MNEEKIIIENLKSKRAAISFAQIFILVVGVFAFAYIVWETEKEIGGVSAVGGFVPADISDATKYNDASFLGQIGLTPELLENQNNFKRFDDLVAADANNLNNLKDINAKAAWYEKHNLDFSGGANLEKYDKNTGEITYITTGNTKIRTTVDTKNLRDLKIKGKIDSQGWFNFKDANGNEGPKMIGGKIKAEVIKEHTIMSIDNGRIDYTRVQEGNFNIKAGEGSQITTKDGSVVSVGRSGISSSYASSSWDTGKTILDSKDGTSYLIKEGKEYSFNGKIETGNTEITLNPDTKFSPLGKDKKILATISSGGDIISLPNNKISDAVAANSNHPVMYFDGDKKNFILGGQGDFGTINLNDPSVGVKGSVGDLAYSDSDKFSYLDIIDSNGKKMVITSDDYITSPEFRGNVDIIDSNNFHTMTSSDGSQLVGYENKIQYHRFANEPVPDVSPAPSSGTKDLSPTDESNPPSPTAPPEESGNLEPENENLNNVKNPIPSNVPKGTSMEKLEKAYDITLKYGPWIAGIGAIVGGVSWGIVALSKKSKDKNSDKDK